MRLEIEEEPRGLVIEDVSDVRLTNGPPNPLETRLEQRSELYESQPASAHPILIHDLAAPRALKWDPRTQGFPRISGTFGFDCEAKDPDLDVTGAGWAFPDNRGHVVGWSFCWGEKGQRHRMYLPIRHEGGGNLDIKAVKRFTRDTLSHSDSTAVVHNRMYDEGWCRREDIPIRCRVFDTGTAAPLLDEYKWSYRLDSLAKEELGRGKNEAALEKYVKDYNAQLRAKGWLEFPEKGKQFTLQRNAWIRTQQIHKKEDIWQMPAPVVEDYAGEDSEDALDLWEVYRPRLEAEDLWGIFVMETRLLPVLIEMRWRGIRVDLDKAEQTRQKFLAKERELDKQIRDMLGFSIDPWNKTDLVKAFDTIGVELGRTPTGQPKVTKETLDGIEHPLGGLVRQQRRYQRTRSQFIEKYVLEKHCRGRVHGEVVPLPSEEGGAVTGRFSMKSPNLENLPNPEKDPEMGIAVRELMLPEEGQLWAALDYKQQEPAMMIHFASVMRIKGAQAAVDAYWAADRKFKETGNPKDRFDFHKFIMDATGLPRVHAKPINLGIGYGMGGAKLCRQLGLPTKWIMSRRQGKMIEIAGDEGQAILDLYHEKAPFVKGITEECERRAKTRGYVRTLFGRRCRFEPGEGNDRHYKACNRVIQGSSADQTKKAMLDLWDAGELSKVPVHDELGCSVEDKAHAERLAEIMVNAVTLRIPLGVDIEIGPSWGATVKEAA